MQSFHVRNSEMNKGSVKTKGGLFIQISLLIGQWNLHRSNPILSGHPVLGGRVVAQCVSNVSFHILSNATQYLADTSTD